MNRGSVASVIREAELALYNAPFDEAGWPGAIDQVRSAVGACTANLVGIGGPLFVPLTFWVGRNAEEATRVSAAPELWGPCNWRVNSVARELDIQHDHHYAVYRASAETSLYDDAMSDLDTVRGCQSAVVMGEAGFVGLALAWGKRTAGLDADALGRFARLRLALNRAVRMQLTFDGEAAELMLGDHEKLHCATWLLDAHASVCAMTRAAEEMMTAGPFRSTSPWLRLADADAQPAFDAALRRLLAGNGVDGPLVHQRRVGGGRFDLTIARLPKRAHGLGFDPHLAVTLRPVRHAVASTGRAG